MSYVGQSRRKLSKRLNEHKRAVKNKCEKSHAKNKKYIIDFYNVQILNNEFNYKKDCSLK